MVDEEHDASYKQEGDPRYDAREVARRRAAEAGAVLLAGTATPRPESWRALERLELPDRVDGRRLPPVEIVDMRGARPGPLHPRTREALAEVRGRGGKAIVLINRRGLVATSSPAAPAATPGSARTATSRWSCTARRQALRCHHCGHAEPGPRPAPSAAR